MMTHLALTYRAGRITVAVIPQQLVPHITLVQRLKVSRGKLVKGMVRIRHVLQKLPQLPVVREKVLLVFLVDSVQFFLYVHAVEERADEELSK